MEEISNLHHPQRQSPKAVILILLKYMRIIVRQMWPILLIVLINPTSGKGIIITSIALGIALICSLPLPGGHEKIKRPSP